jgi:hypothetical protein
MKRIAVTSLAVGLILAALALSGGKKRGGPDLQIDVEKCNPWTHLRLNDAPETFHFVVVSDRTGGHRARIFSQAVDQINLLQPAFVVSVGDLIEGYKKDPALLAGEWKEFQTFVHQLQMPFFYVPGNHDLSNATGMDAWKERFGRRYYHFLYKDVLFLAVNTDDPHVNKSGKIGKEQIAYFQKVLKDNADTRWTIVLLHKPIWTQDDLDTNGWLEMEQALQGRRYTVFAGHVHQYQKFVRQGMNYYQLATTGGGSRLRGIRYGEFDHIAWVTMRKDAPPVIGNILLDGIYSESLQRTITDEEGAIVYGRKPVHPVRGKVMFDGAPAANAQIYFWLADADGKKATRISEALADADGSYAMSTYTAFDGLPAGDFKVTVTLREPYRDASGRPGPNRLPAKYADPATSELSATVASGNNEINFSLTK